MSLDEFQQRWQSQGEARLRVEPELLLAEVRRKQRSFKVTIFWRDFREVFVAAAFVVFFAIYGFLDDHWPSILVAVACLWVGGFILIDRFRRRGRAAQLGDTLRGCVEASLKDVEHQIWLLRNVFWWYLLPLAMAIVISFVSDMIPLDESPSGELAKLVLRLGGCALLFWGVYWLNQWAVKKGLEPRRQELLAVRESLLKSEE